MPKKPTVKINRKVEKQQAREQQLQPDQRLLKTLDKDKEPPPHGPMITSGKLFPALLEMLHSKDNVTDVPFGTVSALSRTKFV